MTAVFDKLERVTGTPINRVTVIAALVATDGWLTDRSGRVIQNAQTMSRFDGTWTLDLTPTGSYEDTGAVYRITEGDALPYLIVVPDSGNPVRARDCLVDAPGAGPQPDGQLISDDTGNQLQLREDGLYAPAVAASVAPFYLTYSRPGPGSLAVSTGTVPQLIPADGDITAVSAAVGTPPVGADLLLRVNINGAPAVTVTIPDHTSQSPVPNDLPVTVAAGDRLTLDVLQVGSTTAGTDLGVVVTVTPT